MLAELLKKWSELEPALCDRQSVSYWIAIGNSGCSIPFENPNFIDVAIVRSAVESAIVLHNLRCRIENDESGWYATIQREDFPPVLQTDKESSIALLKAYIAHLEAKR